MTVCLHMSTSLCRWLSMWDRHGRRKLSAYVSTCPRLCAGGCLCETGMEGENCVSLCLHMSTSLCRWLSMWDRLGRRKLSVYVSTCPCLCAGGCLSEAGWEGRLGRRQLSVSVCVSTCPHLCAGGCLCEAGWEGDNCSVQCRQGSYGTNCSQVCQCLNNATCDSASGLCHCLPGFTGKHCQSGVCVCMTMCICVCVSMCACMCECVCVHVCVCMCAFGMGRIMMGGGDCLNCDSTSGLCHHLPWLVNLCSSAKLVRV